MQKQRGLGPQVFVEQTCQNAEPTPGRWLVAWQIRNLGQQPLRLLAGWLPHSQFRSQERELAPTPRLLPGERAWLEFSVACSEPPGTVVKNAFLILRVLWLGKPWRILARLRVVFNEQGEPQTTTEVMTLQPVGFSEQPQEEGNEGTREGRR